MSNIEPTEEQRQVAVAHCLGTPTPDYAVHWVKTGENVRTERGLTVSAGPVALARLLAEREAKLREGHVAFFHKELDGWTDTNEALRAEVKTLRARVAELERTEAKLTAAVKVSNATNKRRTEREAQHLADIKALREACDQAQDAIDSQYKRDDAAIACRKVLAATAHYDDAKADADAVDMQAWANGSCPEPGCSLANPHEQGAACVKPTDAEGGEG